MSDQAREAQREYARKWRAANPEKQREYSKRHWEKVASLEKQKRQCKEEKAE